MHADEIYQHYLDRLLQESDAWRDYATNTGWTGRSTRALCHAGVAAHPEADAVSKGCRDRYGRSEYLNLDVCVVSDTWDPPHFIGELENSPAALAIEYSAWKLLVVEAEHRVLVGYFGEGEDVPSFDRLRELVEGVCRANPGKDILLIGAERKDAHSNDDVRRMHNRAVVGHRGGTR